MNDTVVIKSGEAVRFPVTSDNPLAKYQQQVDVSQISNLHDLAVVRRISLTNPQVSPSQITSAVRGILASSNVSTILQLDLPDLIVEQGATMTLGGPITTISAGNVIVVGEILAIGSLNVSCTTLGSIMPPVISGISPITGSTLGGTQVGIQGQGLSNVTAVYFGSQPATSFQELSDSQIYASSPPTQVGPVNISVLAYGALPSATSGADIFTYAYLPGVASITVSPFIVWTGSSTPCTITLNEPAASGGSTVTVGVSNWEGGSFSGVTLSTSALVISGGATSGTVQIIASPTAWGAVAISATGADGVGQSTTSIVLVVTGEIILATGQAILSSNDVSSVVPGQPFTITVYVRTPAPSSGGQITLSATTTGHAVVDDMPSSIPLGAGATSAQFTLVPRGAPPGSFTITANYAGHSTTALLAIPLDVTPPRIGGQTGGHSAV